MSESPTLQIDEVRAAIDLEVSVLKTAIEMVVESLASLAAHMNENFTHQSNAIRETQEKHNALAMMVTALAEIMKKVDCIRPED